MLETTLETLNTLVAACDAHHHFYHYKSSWLHLCLADTLRQSGDEPGARKHYEAALFQDHLNMQAKNALGPPPSGEQGNYDSYITSGAIPALAAFEQSLGWEPDTSMVLSEAGAFGEAVRVFAARHDRYHRHASDMHLRRGLYFLRAGETDLAIADFSKALDLHRHNVEALRERAGAYRLKGNERLAQQDVQWINHMAISGT